jgi:hypothetical protein
MTLGKSQLANYDQRRFFFWGQRISFQGQPKSRFRGAHELGGRQLCSIWGEYCFREIEST